MAFEMNAWILVVQQVLAGTPTDLIYRIDRHGSLNYQYCIEWKVKFERRAEKYGDEIVHAGCYLGGTDD